MKIVAISDLHGVFYPPIPECDLLLIAGDLGPWMEFSEWLDTIDLPADHIIGIAGNHDFKAQKKPGLFREMKWTYLEDEAVVVEGLTIYGSPWTPVFYNWAFMKEEHELEKMWALIPEETNILMTHGPPHGYQDMTIRGGVRAGSVTLLERVEQLLNLKLHVFGHIHEGRDPGRHSYYANGAISANVSVLDAHYKIFRAPLEVFMLDTGTKVVL